MDVGSELAPAVVVAKEVAHDSEDDADRLERNMPAGTNDLERL